MMKADIVTIGDEILIGQIVNTNAAFLGEELTKLGFGINRIISVSDTEESIINSLDESINSTDLVILTGGLGPTNDDITKATLLKYFGGTNIIHKPSLERLKKFLANRNVPLTNRNQTQVEIPDSCEPLLNKQGAAPGMVFRKNQTVIVSLPGVPYEMKGLFTDALTPLLQKEFTLPERLHTTLLTVGLSESTTNDTIQHWEESLPEEVRIAYLPSPGLLRIRISISGTNKVYVKKLLEEKEEELIDLIGTRHIFGRNTDTLQAVVGNILRSRGYSLSVAESCTGGAISHLLTLVPGASVFYKGGITAYENKIKQKMLHVNEDILSIHGAVSKVVVEQMAIGVKNQMQSDFSVATSGIAGPTGGTPEKPVGTVWVAVATPNNVISRKYLLGNHRERFVTIASYIALNMLRNAIADTNKNIV